MVGSGPFLKMDGVREGRTLTVLFARMVAQTGSPINLSKDIADSSRGGGPHGAPPDPISRLRIAYKVSSTRSRIRNFLKMLFR